MMQGEVQNQTKKGINRKAIVITLVSIIMISLAISAQLCYMVLKDERIYKGVFIDNLYVGGLTKQQASELIKTNYQDKIQDLEIFITAGDNHETLKFSEIDVHVDVNDTVNKAFAIGRTGNIFDRFSEILEARSNNPVINVVFNYDKEKVEEKIQSLYDKTFIPVKEVELIIQDDVAIVRSGHHGESIDKDLLLKEVENHIQQLKGGNINIPIETTKPAKMDVEDFYKKISREAQNAYVKVENNKVTVIPEVIGISVKKSDLALIAKQLEEREDIEMVIPVEKVIPEITEKDINNKLFKDTLYTAYTSYKTDTQTDKNRTENLRLASSKINGTILAPGEIFSFNNTVGKRTIEAGYKDAMIFRNGKVIPDIGGGICQVSSTLYNAVLYADLEIVERSNHMFVVSYVPYGLDSTVYYGQTDFRFKNSTNWPIKIESWMTNDNRLYFSIKGTNESVGKTVEIITEIVKTIPFTTKYTEDPNLPEGEKKVTQAGQNGYVVNTYKVIKVNGTVKEKKKISTSTYQPLTEEVTIGTKPVENMPEITTPDTTVNPETDKPVSEENNQGPQQENEQVSEQQNNQNPIGENVEVQNLSEENSEENGSIQEELIP